MVEGEAEKEEMVGEEPEPPDELKSPGKQLAALKDRSGPPPVDSPPMLL